MVSPSTHAFGILLTVPTSGAKPSGALHSLADGAGSDELGAPKNAA